MLYSKELEELEMRFLNFESIKFFDKNLNETLTFEK